MDLTWLLASLDGGEPGEQRWVLTQLAGGGKLTRRDLEKWVGISMRTANRELGELVAAGMIKYDGTDRSDGYRMA